MTGRQDHKRSASSDERICKAIARMLLMRDLRNETVERLKARAKRHGRSLQGEVKAILEAAAGYSMAEAEATSAGWHARLAGRAFSDSADLIREDRDR